MEITKLTVTYGVKRTANYQAVEVQVSAEVTLAPGERMEDAFAKTMRRLAPMAEQEASGAIAEITHPAESEKS